MQNIQCTYFSAGTDGLGDLSNDIEINLNVLIKLYEYHGYNTFPHWKRAHVVEIVPVVCFEWFH